MRITVEAEGQRKQISLKVVNHVLSWKAGRLTGRARSLNHCRLVPRAVVGMEDHSNLGKNGHWTK